MAIALPNTSRNTTVSGTRLRNDVTRSVCESIIAFSAST